MPRFEPAGFVPTLGIEDEAIDDAREPVAATCDDEALTVRLPTCRDAYAITMVAGAWSPPAFA